MQLSLFLILCSAHRIRQNGDKRCGFRIYGHAAKDIHAYVQHTTHCHNISTVSFKRGKLVCPGDSFILELPFQPALLGDADGLRVRCTTCERNATRRWNQRPNTEVSLNSPLVPGNSVVIFTIPTRKTTFEVYLTGENEELLFYLSVRFDWKSTVNTIVANTYINQNWDEEIRVDILPYTTNQVSNTSIFIEKTDFKLYVDSEWKLNLKHRKFPVKIRKVGFGHDISVASIQVY